MMLTKNEMTHLLGFLEELSDRFGNDGCNDYAMEDTPENRELFAAVDDHLMKTCHGYEKSDVTKRIHQGKIHTLNTRVLDCLRDKLKREMEGK